MPRPASDPRRVSVTRIVTPRPCQTITTARHFSAASPAERSTRVDARTRIDVERAGPHGGDPLLFIHGFTGAKEDFSGWLDDFAQMGFDVAVFDLPGHGFSDPLCSRDAYDLGRLADEVLGLIDALGWSQINVVGHSMGGMVAQIMAGEHPERFKRAVLMSTHHGPIDLDTELAAFGATFALTNGMVALNDLLKTISLPTTTGVGADLRLDPAYDRFMNEKFERCDPAMFAGMVTSMTTCSDRLGLLGKLRIPTLVMVGENDANFLASSHAIANTIPTATLVELSGAGHNPQFEVPDRWFDLITGFLLADV